MEERITREELLEKLFNDDYEKLKGKKLRLTRVRVPGKSLDFAHVITPSDPAVYQNLDSTLVFTKEKIIQVNPLVLCALRHGRPLWLQQMLQ